MNLGYLKKGGAAAKQPQGSHDTYMYVACKQKN